MWQNGKKCLSNILETAANNNFGWFGLAYKSWGLKVWASTSTPWFIDTESKIKIRDRMDRVSLCDCIRYKKRKQKLHFKVLIFALFGPTSIPSMCGATHAAVAVHVSIDQWDTLQADCTVNKSLTKSLAEPASHSQSDSLSLNSQEQTPQQLHDKSIINPPQPKASNLSEEARTQVAAEKFMTTHTFQATDTTKRSPSLHFHHHPPAPSFSSSWFQRQSAGWREHSEATGAVYWFFWKTRFLFMGQNNVFVI